MSIKTYSFAVGTLACTVIQDAYNITTLEQIGQIFPSIPAEALEHAADDLGFDRERLEFAFNPMFIDTGTQRVLVDTGTGQGVFGALAGIGVEPETINQVVLSHGHADHLAGLIDENGSPRYPNATYVMWKTEWEFWHNAPLEDDEDQAFFRRVTTPIRDRLRLIEHETELAPGICAVAAPGHTPGHMALLLDSGGERLLHIVDAAHSPVQVAHPDWSPRYDRSPELAASTRRRLLERAAQENLLVAAYHFPFPALGRVAEAGAGFVWQPVATG